MIDVKRTSIKEILSFCESYAENMGIRVINNNNELCYASIYEREINLNTKDYRKATIPFAFFHEIGHFKVFHNNLFKVARDVHTSKDFNKLSERDKSIYRLTALRLEQWCDDFGEKESNKHFKNVIAYKPYSKKSGKDFIRENFYY